MTEYIYGDILFIINFSMDFLSLFIVGKIMHFRMGAIRMILAASVGAIYGVASLFFSLNTFFSIAADLAVALIMCFAAHYHKNIIKTLISTALFYGVSMLLGGIMTAVYTKIGRYKSYIEIGGSINTVFGDIDLWVFCLLAALSALLTFFIGKYSHRKLDGKFCRLKIKINGKTYEFSGFFDSGNLASEPITGEPVVFLSSDALREFQNDGSKTLFCAVTDINSACSEKDRNIRFIPLDTVSGGGLAVAIKPEKFEILIKNKYEERVALIASDESANDYCGAQALVPTSLV